MPNALQYVRPLRAPVAQILPSRSDVLVVLPVTQADRQPQKRSASREIVPVQRPSTILSCCQKSILKQRGTMVGTSNKRRKKGGDSDPRVRFLVKERVVVKKRSHPAFISLIYRSIFVYSIEAFWLLCPRRFRRRCPARNVTTLTRMVRP